MDVDYVIKSVTVYKLCVNISLCFLYVFILCVYALVYRYVCINEFL